MSGLEPTLSKSLLFTLPLYMILSALWTLYKGYSVKATLPLPAEQLLNPSMINYKQTLLFLIRIFLLVCLTPIAESSQLE